MSQHKVEAYKALKTVLDTLAGPEPIDGLRRHQLRANVEYAMEQVALIQEVKRARKKAVVG